MLDALWCNYFDDFPTIALKQEAESVMSAVHLLFGILGWRFARDGDKAHPFARTVQALGVLLDVSSMHLGKTVFANTEARTSSPIDALRIRGRLRFASRLLGRVSRLR